MHIFELCVSICLFQGTSTDKMGMAQISVVEMEQTGQIVLTVAQAPYSGAYLQFSTINSTGMQQEKETNAPSSETVAE